MLNAKEIAKFFNVDDRTIRTWTNQGWLPFIKTSGIRGRKYILEEVIKGKQNLDAYLKDKQKNKRRNFLHQKIGNLLVIECIEENLGYNNLGLWKVSCDCGNIITTPGINLYWRRSCGCLFIEAHKKSSILKRRYGTVTINHEYNNYKSQCKQAQRHPLNKEIWLSIVLLPCYYCGDIDIRNRAYKKEYITKTGTKRTYEEKNKYSVQLNGIDRVDSSKGYELDNCVPCCFMCNRMKNNFKKDDFFNKIEKIYKLHIGKCSE